MRRQVSIISGAFLHGRREGLIEHAATAMFVSDSACLQKSVFEFQYFGFGRGCFLQLGVVAMCEKECDELFQDSQFFAQGGATCLKCSDVFCCKEGVPLRIFMALSFRGHCYAEPDSPRMRSESGTLIRCQYPRRHDFAIRDGEGLFFCWSWHQNGG